MAVEIVLNYLENFLGLLFPNNCALCNAPMNKYEQVICLKCLYALPKTHFHLLQENEVYLRMAGRFPIAHACALYFFDKGGYVQKLIHQLKYQGAQETGKYLGNILGQDLKSSPNYSDIDWVIPVPLHPEKQKKRGYNQAACFARGIAESLACQYAEDWLVRTRHTESQTGKNKFNRWENVKEAFNFMPNQNKTFNHLLIVDDVITTGATLEACLMHIPQNSKSKISIATIAFAHN